MLERMGEFFDARLEGYEQHQLDTIASAREFYPFTGESLAAAKGTKILDLGCGTGLELDWLFQYMPDAEVTGIDLAPGMLEALRNKFPGKKLELIQGSYFEVPLGKDRYDAAVSVESLHHFTKEEKIPLYEKVRDSLRPGGFFLLTDYFALSEEEEKDRRQELVRLKQEQGIADSEICHFDTPLTVQHEREALLTAGFGNVRIIRSWGPTFMLIAEKEGQEDREGRMREIETERLLLRPFRETDHDDLYEFLSQLRDDEFEGYPGITYENCRKYLVERMESDDFYAVELREEGRVIGNIYCAPRSHGSREVGYIINRDYQRRGYALEALRAVMDCAFREGAHRVFAQCDPRNEASRSLLEKAGLRREAHMRRNIYFRRDENGHPVWVDTYLYALLAEEHAAGKDGNKRCFDAGAFWKAVISQDRESLPAYFSGDAVIYWPCTNEQFTVQEYVTANCEYPGKWQGEIERITQTEDETVIAGRVFSDDGTVSCHVTGFIRTEDGLITGMTEYWADDGDAPQWRRDLGIGRPLRE